MAAPPPHAALTVVALGDSHSGKTWLLHSLCGKREEVVGSSQYRPTVGAEMMTVATRFHGTDVDVTFWDYPGNERLCPSIPGPVVVADVGVLVVDITDPHGVEHLDQWHDEFVRLTCDGVAMPAFVVVLTKIDRGDKRVVFRDDVAKWCARQHVEPLVWPSAVVGSAQPVPPVVECSVESGEGITAVMEHIAHRGILRQRINSGTKDIALQIVLEAQRTIQQGGAWVAAVIGDVKPPPMELCGGGLINIIQGQKGRSYNLLLWNAPSPLVPANSVLCRNAHVGIITVPVTDSVNTSRIRLWQEIVLREGMLRDVNSLAWVVLAVHAPTRTPTASRLLSEYCVENGIMVVDLPVITSPAHYESIWDRISEYVARYTGELLASRSEQHAAFASTPCVHPKCSWVGRAIDLQKHLTTCDFVTVPCRWEGCPHISHRFEREEHEKFCSKRPPVCHFCSKPYDGPLYTHLVYCQEREAFERTHVACPLTELGCTSTRMERGSISTHIDAERIEHIQILASSVLRMKQELMEQERRHSQEIESMKQSHAAVVEGLRGEVLLARAVADKHQDALKEVSLEFRLVWDEIEALKRKH